MTRLRLLVSVRDAREAAAAVRGGADVVDVKEPSAGSLGMAPSKTVADVAEAVGRCGTLPTSAALGELAEWAQDAAPALPASLSYAKVGLAGCGGRPDWQRRHARFRRAVEERSGAGFAWIAVAYADWKAADAPSPDEVVEAAVGGGCAGLLFDTHGKAGGRLFDWLSPEDLCRLVEPARKAGLLVALAGRLNASDVDPVRETAPDVLAVRSAVCEGGRNGRVAEQAVSRLRQALEPDLRPSPVSSFHRPALVDRAGS